MAQSNWLSEQFRRSPLTVGLITVNLITWLITFFTQSNLCSALLLSDARSAPWTLLTYPLYTPAAPFSLLLTCFVLHWCGSSLESLWGTRKFASVTLALTLLSGVSMNLAPRLFGLPGLPLAGLYQPAEALFVMWAMLNPGAVILVMFVLPIQARLLGYLTLVMVYFDNGPVLGLFALVAPLLGWLYVRRTRFGGSPVRKSPAKSGGRNLIGSWLRSRRKKSMRVLEGGLVKDSLPSMLRLQASSAELEVEVDRILAKIHREGMSALTPAEKAQLEAHSRRLRGV